MKANVKGGIVVAKPFPITKLPPQNKAAITSKIYGDFQFTLVNPPVVKIFRTNLILELSIPPKKFLVNLLLQNNKIKRRMIWKNINIVGEVKI